MDNEDKEEERPKKIPGTNSSGDRALQIEIHEANQQRIAIEAENKLKKKKVNDNIARDNAIKHERRKSERIAATLDFERAMGRVPASSINPAAATRTRSYMLEQRRQRPAPAAASSSAAAKAPATTTAVGSPLPTDGITEEHTPPDFLRMNSGIGSTPPESEHQVDNFESPADCHDIEEPGSTNSQTSTVNAEVCKQKTLTMMGKEEPDKKHTAEGARKVQQTTSSSSVQFNSIWETSRTSTDGISVEEKAKGRLCYICGCLIKDNHFPEMEHFITPGEFFHKFGIELITNSQAQIISKGTIDDYEAIHMRDCNNANANVRTRLDKTIQYLNNHVTNNRVDSGFDYYFRTQYNTSVRPPPTSQEKTWVKYSSSFFVPQIKAYMSEFIYSHHICNQIKGNMPTLSPGYTNIIEPAQGGDYTLEPNNLFSIYANVLVDAIFGKFKGKGSEIYKKLGFWNNNVGSNGKSWIAAPQLDKYTVEIGDIQDCLRLANMGIDTRGLKTILKKRIENNMLYHSLLLREIKRDCTVQRIISLNHIVGYSRRIVPLEKDHHGKTILSHDSIRTTDLDEDMGDALSVSSQLDNFDDEIEKDDLDHNESLFTGHDNDPNKKLMLTSFLFAGNMTTKLTHDELKQYITNNSLNTVADLMSARVIHKTYKILPKPWGRVVKVQKGGGKRTKRRRGRGKSKKKVTRKKRVKRRKTVKKIKRKRRRTRKC
uniref:Uncharacterized protein n=1 Tax=viral metagenome TaxID=1070528 RepID=A0A6C0BR65_9ZZZZ